MEAISAGITEQANGRYLCRNMASGANLDLSYLGKCPAGFVAMADVVFEIAGKRLPAHSQFLASQSRLIQGLLQDTGPISQQNPLILSSALQGHSLEGVLTFLQHTYKDLPLTTEKEAWDLLPIADQFDSPSLTDKAVSVIESSHGFNFFDQPCNGKDALDWWQLAERFGLLDFKARCIEAVARHFEALQHDDRLLQLSPSAAVELMRAIQHVLEKRTVMYCYARPGCGRDTTEETRRYFCTANRCSGHHVQMSFGPKSGYGTTDYEVKRKTGTDACPGAQEPHVGRPPEVSSRSFGFPP